MANNNKDKKAKLKAIMGAMKNLEKSTKKEGILQRLGDAEPKIIETTPTGSLMFDIALGNGIPKGRIIEFFGAESSGKTLCATRAMAQVQQQGGICALIDMEHAFDPSFAAKLGLNSDDLFLSQPDHMQDAFAVIDALIDSGGVDMIVLDSVAALVPKEELEGDVGKQTIGLIARYMSQFLRRITPKASQMGVTVIFINQIRDAIGVMYGDPTTTPGGKALKFYCSVRCQIARVGGSQEKVKIGGEEQVVGHTIRATVKKNKVAPPFRKAEFPIWYDGRETDPADEIAAVSLLKGLIPKYAADGTISPTGRTYKFEADGEELIAKKKDDVAIELRKYPKIQAKLIDMIKNGVEATDVHQTEDFDSEMSEEDFEEMMRREAEDIKNGGNDAEETSGGAEWDDL
ncbi:UvsX-like recombinase [Bacillus phage G]|uniref:Gp407 n=1 Tax=Bacillus phage G TaxID=2884420 RepID=G3MAE8_9CAUD|nr:UvsX-like recombinase [Bacillus phage G]AEO93665.1 gp407 [Bacillus phage G]